MSYTYKQSKSLNSSQRKSSWSNNEDEALVDSVRKYGGKNWKLISEQVDGKTHLQCLHRWKKVLDPDLVKGPWGADEDEKLMSMVGTYGTKKWSIIAEALPGRIGKQCRERWTNHLDPSLKKGDWEPYEDQIILEMQTKHGNKWARIAKMLPGRSDNAVKNRYNSTISRRLKNQEDDYLIDEKENLVKPHLIPKMYKLPSILIKSPDKQTADFGFLPQQNLRMNSPGITHSPSILRKTSSPIPQAKKKLYDQQKNPKEIDPSWSRTLGDITNLDMNNPKDYGNITIEVLTQTSEEYKDMRAMAQVIMSLSDL